MASPLPAAVRRLLAQQQVEPTAAEPLAAPGCWRITGQRWVAVQVPGRAAPLHVALPVQGEVRTGPDRQLEAQIPPPSEEDVAEAAAFARSLAAHGQIGASGASGARGTTTHRVVVDAQGREKLVRRGFSGR